MYLTRHLDLALIDLTKRGLVRGPMHTSLGQEAVGVGTTVALRPTDTVMLTHRPHAGYVGFGVPLKEMVAEMMGRDNQLCHGRAGHMLIAHKSAGFLAASGIVGQSLTYSIGHAYAQRYHGSDRITLCITGDGAVNEGAFNEALNMAALWRLPIVFVIENNHYGLTTHLRRHVHNTDLHERILGYGIPAIRIDGNDVETVFSTAQTAISYSRSGNGPIAFEALTYRQTGFSTSDMGGYQTPEERAQYKDPLDITRGSLLSNGISESTISALEAQVHAELEEALEFGANAPWPTPAALTSFAAQWDGELA